MNEFERQVHELSQQLHDLRNRQIQMHSEIIQTEKKLDWLKTHLRELSKDPGAQIAFSPAEASPSSVRSTQNQPEKAFIDRNSRFHLNQEMENFIGTNLISKIGILVTIIGVFIGAKYAIDKELISPFLRIVAGYLAGLVLITVAIRLKKKYDYFSSILIGGGVAVIYFITYIAYSYYQLYPLVVAFIIMVVTTAFAVGIALWYNQKVIALLGQVGAYFIPFLLGGDNGNVLILFSYITLINLGLLFLSFKKDWKILYHIAFFLTCLIYLLLVVVAGKTAGSFFAGITFLSINFFTFYVTFLAYKIFKKELYQVGEIAVLLLNALLFFFLGTFLIEEEFHNIHYHTWFTVVNACIHFAVGYFIFRLRLLDQSVFQFILGLGLLFFTLAVPIEFDGNWVTVLWTLEATALFYVGKNTNRELYLEIAIPLIVISFFSLIHDWVHNYQDVQHSIITHTSITKMPFLNINFTLSLFVSACIGFMSFFKNNFEVAKRSNVANFFLNLLPVGFLVVLYFTLYNEIDLLWDRNQPLNVNSVAVLYKPVILLAYSCLYIAAWLFINNRWIRSKKLMHLLFAIALVANILFLSNGLYAMGELRDYYIANAANASKLLLFIRYFSFTALALLWIGGWNAMRIFKPSNNLSRSISVIGNITLLWLISNEFIHWMDLAGYQNQYKLGLSLICGGYALALLFVGMVRKKKHLRVSAIVLFAGTLLKLFFYDLTSLSTISKTIVLVLLGILLLLASFLYNKYKDLLFTKEEGDTRL